MTKGIAWAGLGQRAGVNLPASSFKQGKQVCARRDGEQPVCTRAAAVGYPAEGREGSSPFSTRFKMTQKQPSCWGGGNERAGSGMVELPCPVQPFPNRFPPVTPEEPQLHSSQLSQRMRIWVLFLPHDKMDGNPSPKRQVLGSATAFKAPLDHPGSAGACCGSSFVNPGRRLVLAARLPAGTERCWGRQHLLALSTASEAELLLPQQVRGGFEGSGVILGTGNPEVYSELPKTPNSAVLDKNVFTAGHVSAPINTRPARGGPADSEMSARRVMGAVAASKPRHMPEPACLKTARGDRRQNEWVLFSHELAWRAPQNSKELKRFQGDPSLLQSS